MAFSVPTPREWIHESDVEALSETLHDSPEVRANRLEAYRLFTELPLEPDPLYRKYGYFAGVDLKDINPSLSGPPTPLRPSSPDQVRIVHDIAGTRLDVPEALNQAGVRGFGFAELWDGASAVRSRFLGEPESHTDRLSALSTALLNRGYRLEIPDGFRAPVRIQEVTILTHPHEAVSIRRSIRAGAGCQLLHSDEIYASRPESSRQRFYAAVTDLEVGESAKVVSLSLHAPDLMTVGVSRRRAKVGAGACLAWVWTGFGGFRTKVRNRTDLVGNGSAVDDLQTFYGASDQSYDSAVQLTHLGTDTHGTSVTRGVFKDRARGMSRGLVRIEKDARKTLSFISEHAMLLSREARSDTLPILEILCRDVKATHSTSVAPVDPEKVFYLGSRGIGPDDAVRMISEGFLSHVLDRAPIESLREVVYPYLDQRWRDVPLVWGENASLLPELSVSGTEVAPDWRFDTKLR